MENGFIFLIVLKNKAACHFVKIEMLFKEKKHSENLESVKYFPVLNS